MTKMSSVFLSVLLLVVALSAFVAGAGMINGGIGISDAWLEHTPFTSWTLPGVALIFIVGIPQLAALMAMILRWPEERALGMTAGVVLMAWIAVEIAWMWHFNPWQPLLFVTGAAEFVLSRRSFEPQPIHHAHMR